MGYSVKLAKATMKDLKNLKSAHLEQKFKDIMEILKENPFQNPPPYEKLVGNLKDKYSRRLNIQHRVVYSADTDAKKVIMWSAWTHDDR